MRKLKIDTYSNDTGKHLNSLSIPVCFAKAIAKLLPTQLAKKFDENGQELEDLVDAVLNAKEPGVFLEITDLEDNENFVLSLV